MLWALHHFGNSCNNGGAIAVRTLQQQQRLAAKAAVAPAAAAVELNVRTTDHTSKSDECVIACATAGDS
jgi:hypothetical protein